MKLATGTSGYSYKEWKGSFYPEDLPAAGMLGFYAGRLSTVEINNTFYRMPNAATVEKWGSEVPEGFTFVLKASQRITHLKRLKDASGELDYFLGNAARLGSKLGPILFQLPPNAKKNTERLTTFLAGLPKDRRYVFEFRNESWFDEEIYAALRAHDAALCFADDEDEEAVKTPLLATARFGYLRLRRCDYTEDNLREWAVKIKAQPWEEAFVFFKHEDDAAGPKAALEFNTLFTST